MMDTSDPDHSTVDIRTIQLNGKDLTFTTKSRTGVVFTFSGRFLRGGDLTKYVGKEVPVLEGTVRKFRKGKKVAEARSRFCCVLAG